MATTTINALPAQTVLEPANLLVVQDGPDTKQMAVSLLTAASNAAVDAHIADATAVHAASAITAVPSGGSMSGADVQTQLGQAATAITGLGTSKQAADPDLTVIAGLTATTDNVIQSVASAWASRTPAQLKTTLALSKGDVGLGNVDNTSDASKPISTTQAAVNAAKADKVTAINTTAPLAGGGDLSAGRTLSVSNFTTSAAGVVPASGGGSVNYLRADGTWSPPTTPPIFTPLLPGLVPASGGGTTTYLRADGTWVAPATGGAGLTDGDKGDIVVSGSGTVLMFDTAVVTAAAKTVLDDTTTAAMKTTLGLGNVDNTSDVNKPVSTAQAAADATKVTNGGGVATIVTLTQAAYDGLGSKVATTLYVIVG